MQDDQKTCKKAAFELLLFLEWSVMQIMFCKVSIPYLTKLQH